MEENKNYWKKCNTCGKEIAYDSSYQSCSVSGCKKFAYCSVDCWNLHSDLANHKSAWAEQTRAPQEGEERAPRKILVTSKQETPASEGLSNDGIPHDILIVASKLKAYIKARSDLNTSGNVMERLSDIVRRECDKAIANAREQGRKTVMDRDFLD